MGNRFYVFMAEYVINSLEEPITSEKFDTSAGAPM